MRAHRSRANRRKGHRRRGQEAKICKSRHEPIGVRGFFEFVMSQKKPPEAAYQGSTGIRLCKMSLNACGIRINTCIFVCNC